MKWSYVICCVWLAADSCMEPLDFQRAAIEPQLVVDGFISNEPGPYTVKLYRTRPLGIDLDRLSPVTFARVYLSDNHGNRELLREIEQGVYKTSANGIRGVVGNSYHIEITTSDGREFISESEEIKTPGIVDSIYYQLESLPSGNVFSIFTNATGANEDENFFRLRMEATYKIETFPYLHTRAEGFPPVEVPDPFACSGYIVNAAGQLEMVGECECCFCWVTRYEDIPVVASNNFFSGSRFRNVAVGTVPVNSDVFYEKVHIEVRQLSLTNAAYRFWELIRAQQLGVADLFQPAIARIPGNIKSKTAGVEAHGIFWAAGVSKKSIFIHRNDPQITFAVGPIEQRTSPCQLLKFSTSEKPEFW